MDPGEGYMPLKSREPGSWVLADAWQPDVPPIQTQILSLNLSVMRWDPEAALAYSHAEQQPSLYRSIRCAVTASFSDWE